MKTPMPASPFQYDSMVVPSAMDESRCVKQAPASGAAAEIPGALVMLAPDIEACGSQENPGDRPAACELRPGPERCTGQDRPLTNSSFTAGGPQRALPAVADPHETGGALVWGKFNCLTAADEALYWKLVIEDHPSAPDLPRIPDEAAFMEAIEASPLFLETFPLNAREQA